MQDRFSHPTYRGHTTHLNTLKAIPHPVGGSCWKETSGSDSATETNTGWREDDFSAPDIMSARLPVPFPIPLLHSQMLKPGSSLDRCQMHMDMIDWLISCVYLGSTHQTDSLHCRTVGDFLKVNLINTEQCHITGRREGCSSRMWAWCGVLGALSVWSDVIWSVIVVLPLEALSTYLHNEQDRKSVFWCISTFGRFIAQSYHYQWTHCVNYSLWDAMAHTVKIDCEDKSLIGYKL